MDVKLVVANGKLAGKSVRVTGSKFFIGRGEDCNLRPASDLVSRHHCVIIVDGDYVAVRDLGSKNGTFVNGQRVRTEYALKDGDHLLVGVLEFIVKIGAAAEAPKAKPKVESVQQAVARTASASSTEFDVDQWLSEEEVGPESPSHAETRTIQIKPPESAAQQGPHATPEQTPEKEVDEETKKTLAGLFSDDERAQEGSSGTKKQEDSGKFQKPQPPDTRQAAADVLKSLFRRT